METQTNPNVPPAGAAPAALPAPTGSKKSGLVMTLVAVVATAVIVGGATYFWQSSLVRRVSLSYEQSIVTLNQQVAELQEQMLEIQNNAAEKEEEFSGQIAELQDKLEVAEFKLAILDLWGVKNVVRSSEKKNNFYYSNNFGSASNIGYYNSATDLTYNSTGGFDIANSNSLIYSESLDEGMEFSLLAVEGDELIFWEKTSDEDPEMCTSPWLSEELSSIDLSADVTTRKAYQISEERREAEQAEARKCTGTEPLGVGGSPPERDVAEEGEAMEEGGNMTEDENAETNS